MYATFSDVERRLDPIHLIELVDDNQDGTADMAIVETAIQDADGVIDTYLQGRYAVPFEAPPALVRRLSIDLAVAALFARRREAASPAHETRAHLAMEILKALAQGEIVLGGVSAKAVKGAPESTTRSEEKTFSRYSLGAF